MWPRVVVIDTKAESVCQSKTDALKGRIVYYPDHMKEDYVEVGFELHAYYEVVAKKDGRKDFGPGRMVGCYITDIRRRDVGPAEGIHGKCRTDVNFNEYISPVINNSLTVFVDSVALAIAHALDTDFTPEESVFATNAVGTQMLSFLKYNGIILEDD